MALPVIADDELYLPIRQKLNVALGDAVSFLHYIPYAQHAAILAGTSDYDCADAFDAAMEDIPIDGMGALYARSGLYQFSRRLQLKRTVRLVGDHSGQALFAGIRSTLFQFPSDVGGIVVHRSDTYGDGIEDDPSTGAADGSIIEGIEFIGGGGSGQMHGIQLRARAILRSVSVRSFSGNGIHIDASASSALEDPSRLGNANNFAIYSARVVVNGGHGLFVKGADANAGLAMNLDSTNNGELHGGWGIMESSFLGNTYVGCHTSGNWGGSVKTTNANARSLFVGCYNEGGQEPAEIAHPSMVIGGAFGLFAESADGGYIDSGIDGGIEVSKIVFRHPNIVHVLNGNPSGQEMSRFRKGDGEYWSHRFESGTDDVVLMSPNNDIVYRFTGPGTSFGEANGRPSPATGAAYFRNLFVGSSETVARKVTSSSDEPTSGDWGRDDIAWKEGASPGGILGWICTTGGTAGVDAVFKTFGSISA